MFLPVRASASVLVAVSVRPTASSSSRYGGNPASEVISEPRNCSSRRRSKSSLSTPLFASPVGSAITAPVNPPQDAEFYIIIASNALKIAASSEEWGLKCRNKQIYFFENLRQPLRMRAVVRYGGNSHRISAS